MTYISQGSAELHMGDSGRGQADGQPRASAGRGVSDPRLRQTTASANYELRRATATPSLRNVAQTAPYMHTGQLASLAEVLAFYRTLPAPPLPGHRDGTLRPLDARVDDRDLEAFLRALTGGLPDRRWLEPVTAP